MDNEKRSIEELEAENALLRQKLEELTASNTAKEVFLSNMSHDIRTPMNAIVGMTALAKKHIDEKGRVTDALSKIENASAHLLSLINDVLDMSQINSGKLTLSVESFSLSDLIHDTMTIMRPQIDAKGHRFVLDVSDVSREYLRGDVLRLRQIIVNILSNAVKYTPAGGNITMRVSVTQQGEGCLFTFSCRDTGIGMSEEFLQKIFEPFERVRNSTVSGIEGTGLGMSIVFRIVEAMGGDIDIESEPAKGTEVTIRIPLGYEDVKTDDSAVSGRSIMFIGENEEVRDRLEKYLKESDAVFSCYGNMTQALSAITKADMEGEICDIIILGEFGEGPGIVFDSAAYLHKSFPSVKLVLTGEQNWEDIEYRALRCGITTFIPVPFFHRTLIAGLTGALRSEGNDAHGYPDLSGRRILLVEDNMINREIAREILSMTHAEVQSASDGSEAVKMYTDSGEGYYDLILMDIQMPVMDGYEATGKIRSSGRADSESIPIYAMTANTFAEDIARARSAGMNGHIAKPIDINSLMQVLRGSITGPLRG